MEKSERKFEKSHGSGGQISLFGVATSKRTHFLAAGSIPWSRLVAKMAEKPASRSGSSGMGATAKVLIGVGVLGALGAAAAVVMLGSKKPMRDGEPDPEILEKLLYVWI